MKFKLYKNFRDDESGGILAFTLIMFLVMVLGGGMAVDFMNYEHRREGVQDALDRGVLAAAGLGKDAKATSPAEIAAAEAEAIVVVHAYVRSAGFDPVDLGLVVEPDFTINSQFVAAVSNFNVDTYFLKVAGINRLNGGASSSALVARNDIELSLIVDISGSMRGSKIIDLRTAASNFVGTMLSGDRPDYTTISLVPFSAQVRPSDALISQFNLNRWHNYSSCVDFSAADYNSTSISTSASLTQTQHWRPNWVATVDGGDVFWCPPTRHEIVPWSNSIAVLDDAIDDLTATGNTAAYLGMKWGTALLDEDAQSILTTLSAMPGANVDSAFSTHRPSAFDDDETMKFIILMTDGANTGGYRVSDSQYNETGTSNWRHQDNADYWNENDVPWSYSHLRDRVTNAQGDARLQTICTEAKDEGVIIFTIGYDVPVGSNPHTQMVNCASTASHFYPVDSGDLNAAFSSIAQSIQKLKLVN